MRDSYFYFDVNARPHRRVTFYASYRFNDDPGQGDRRITRPQDMIHSWPFRTHAPEVKLAFKLHRNIDWNVGYQYHSYRDESFVHPFAAPVVVIPAQNYTAHMPYTSVRIYFGRSSGDR